MILWGGTTALMVSVFTFFHDKNTEIPEYISHFIIYPLGGVIFASILWPWKPMGVLTNQNSILSDGFHHLTSIFVKNIIAPLLLMVTIGCANEDHLILVSVPVQYGTDISIVKVPHVCGHSAYFDSYCEEIGRPFMARVNSPNKFAEQVDVNPVSVAGINISLKNDEVILDYSKAKAESKQDRELLRAMVDCIHKLRDSEGSMELVEVDIQLLGLDKESVLHAELAQCLEARKKAVEKSKEKREQDLE